MLRNLRLYPLLNIIRLNLAFCGILEGNISSRPFFVIQIETDDRCVRDMLIFQQDCFKFRRGDLEAVDFNEFLTSSEKSVTSNTSY